MRPVVLRVRVFSATSEPASHPKITIDVPSGFRALCGGGTVNWRGSGSLLYASYPSGDASSWTVAAKDHLQGDEATITGYCLALEDPEDQFEVKIVTSASEAAAHPSGVATLSSSDMASCSTDLDDNSSAGTWQLVGGGGFAHWGGSGSLLTRSSPAEDGVGWNCSAKDHGVSDPCSLDTYAVYLRSRVDGFRIQTVIREATSEGSVPHPRCSISASPGEGWTCVGGGARAHQNPGGPGSLLWDCRPGEAAESANTFMIGDWTAAAKDHLYSDPSAVTVYAIYARVV